MCSPASQWHVWALSLGPAFYEADKLVSALLARVQAKGSSIFASIIQTPEVSADAHQQKAKVFWGPLRECSTGSVLCHGGMGGG